ncbi:hypothetical protein HYT84_03235, partial [Candidatus Micrarchaeota archaeon]|nr:hypothetical protein [Candidatus Micrarchaeota archaeon]
TEEPEVDTNDTMVFEAITDIEVACVYCQHKKFINPELDHTDKKDEMTLETTCYDCDGRFSVTLRNNRGNWIVASTGTIEHSGPRYTLETTTDVDFYLRTRGKDQGVKIPDSVIVRLRKERIGTADDGLSASDILLRNVIVELEDVDRVLRLIGRHPRFNEIADAAEARIRTEEDKKQKERARPRTTTTDFPRPWMAATPPPGPDTVAPEEDELILDQPVPSPRRSLTPVPRRETAIVDARGIQDPHEARTVTLGTPEPAQTRTKTEEIQLPVFADVRLEGSLLVICLNGIGTIWTGYLTISQYRKLNKTTDAARKFSFFREMLAKNNKLHNERAQDNHVMASDAEVIQMLQLLKIHADNIREQISERRKGKTTAIGVVTFLVALGTVAALEIGGVTNFLGRRAAEQPVETPQGIEQKEESPVERKDERPRPVEAPPVPTPVEPKSTETKSIQPTPAEEKPAEKPTEVKSVEPVPEPPAPKPAEEAEVAPPEKPSAPPLVDQVEEIRKEGRTVEPPKKPKPNLKQLQKDCEAGKRQACREILRRNR